MWIRAFDEESNCNWSQNKIEEFEETLYDYTNGFEIVNTTFSNTDISFSPAVIAGSSLSYQPAPWLTGTLLTKYVGRQFLDNTASEQKSIADYLLNEFRLQLNPKLNRLDQLQVMFTVYNLFDEEYSSNGYTYSYKFGDLVTENFYYPQAGRHFMLGVILGF